MPRALPIRSGTHLPGRDWECGEEGAHHQVGQVGKLRPRIRGGTFKVTQRIGDIVGAGTLGPTLFRVTVHKTLLGVECGDR